MNDILAKLDAIEAGLDGVTGGDWTWCQEVDRLAPEGIGSLVLGGEGMIAEATFPADAAHIARLDKLTVREMIRLARLGAEAADAIATLRAENERLREALRALQIQALQSDVNTPHNEWGREALALARAALENKS